MINGQQNIKPIYCYTNPRNCYVIQGLELEDKYMDPLKNVFMIFSIIDIVKWIIMFVGGILSAAGVYLLVHKLTNKAAVVLGRNSPEVAPLDLETPPRY
jgi:hypothetical protein